MQTAHLHHPTQGGTHTAATMASSISPLASVTATANISLEMIVKRSLNVKTVAPKKSSRRSQPRSVGAAATILAMTVDFQNRAMVEVNITKQSTGANAKP